MNIDEAIEKLTQIRQIYGNIQLDYVNDDDYFFKIIDILFLKGYNDTYFAGMVTE